MQSVGIDLGTTFTKTSNERIFPSGISENIYLSNNVMELEGKKYAMGLLNNNSIFDVNINKSLNRNTRLNFLYALHMESNSIDCEFSTVITALPCSQWKNDKTVEQFKNMLNLHEPISINLNGLTKKIYIQDLDIIPEGATAYYAIDYLKFNGRKVLVCDIGGLTINTILYENDEIIDLYTDEFGVLKIYKDMAEKITSETGHTVRMDDMHDILTYGFIHNGEIIDIEPIIKPIGLEYCDQIYKNLKLKWQISNIPFIPLVGAGSIVLYKYLREYIPHAELQENAQLLAAIGMREMVGGL